MEGSQLRLQSVWQVCSGVRTVQNYLPALESRTGLFTGARGGVAHTDSVVLGLVNGVAFASSTLILVISQTF